MKLAVIGGGAAGVAAAWAAKRGGAEATVFFDRAGATSLYSGALDLVPWEAAHEGRPIEPDLFAFATAFDAWSLGPTPCRAATFAGVLRPARGLDTGVLDLSRLAGRSVAVADVPVEGWEAGGLARSLGAFEWALRTNTRFEAVRVDGFLSAGEAAVPWVDLAEAQESPARQQQLATALARSGRDVDAWLLGPWLGAVPGVAERISGLVGKPCGETTSPPGGAAGARFEASRDALLDGLGIRVERRRVESVKVEGSEWRVATASVASAADAREWPFDAVVLAVGGVVAGGIELFDGGFRCSVGAPVQVGLDGRTLHAAASVHGVDFAALGMSALERAGIIAERSAVPGVPGLFVAGDAVEGRPRTVLEAARAGIAAAKRALS